MLVLERWEPTRTNCLLGRGAPGQEGEVVPQGKSRSTSSSTSREYEILATDHHHHLHPTTSSSK